MGEQPTEPGWYKDPGGIHEHQGYWDGEKWTGETREGRKDARRARERTWRRGWTIAIAVVGGLLLVSWWLDTPSDYEVAAQALTESGIIFVYPDEWSQMAIDDPPDEPVWEFYATPGNASNWISIMYIPESDAAAWDATPATFGQLVEAVSVGNRTIVSGPDTVNVAGLDGHRMTVQGIVGEQTGDTLSGEFIVLYDTDASYVLRAQYDQDSERTVLTAWETMLANFDAS